MANDLGPNPYISNDLGPYNNQYVRPSPLFVTSTGSFRSDGYEANPYTFEEAVSVAISGDHFFVKADDQYNYTGIFNIGCNGDLQYPIRWEGYGVTTGDKQKPLLSFSETGVVHVTGSYNHFHNLHFSGASNIVSNLVIHNTGNYCIYDNVIFDNYSATYPFLLNTSTTTQTIFNECYFGGYGYLVYIVRTSLYKDCIFNQKGGNYGPVLEIKGGGWIEGCVFIGGDRASTLLDLDNGAMINNCIFYNCPEGSSVGTVYHRQVAISNSIIWDGAQYGVSKTISTYDGTEHIMLNNVAIGNCTAGRTNGLLDTQENNPITLTVDPFVDSSNFDFRLNDLPGGGRECRRNNIGPPRLRE